MSNIIQHPNRGEIRLSGPTTKNFLQRIVTNNIDLAGDEQLCYACLLTPQGKFLFDFFIRTNGPDTFILDCEGDNRAEALASKLILYKLREKIDIEIIPDRPVYIDLEGLTGIADPRHTDLGTRIYDTAEVTADFETWDQRRIALAIADGSRDAALEKSTLEELNIHRHHGVAYDKGCFLGQELTARMHHRGLAKKHLVPLQGDLPEPFEPLEIDGKTIGEMRSICGNMGLAVIRNDKLEEINNSKFQLLSS